MAMGSNAGGFSFDLCKRNALLEKKGVTLPTAWKTGTTIVGLIFKVITATKNFKKSIPLLGGLWQNVPPLQDGVILGADTRATSGSTVADKNCAKIHYVQPNIYCCGAGTAADCEAVTGTGHC